MTRTKAELGIASLDSRYVTLNQSTPQTIGDTINRLAKLWATEITVTNAITGSVTGNAGTVTTNANLTGPITSIGNATSIASQTGTGTKFVVDTSPTIVTPTIASLIGNKIYPASDSVTAIQINKANGSTNVLDVDTTNGRVGIGTASPNYLLDVNGTANGTDLLAVNSLTVGNGTVNPQLFGVSIQSNAITGIFMNVAGNGQYARGFIGWQRANGSLANPTPLVANDSLASFTIYGHNNNGTTYNQGAFIEAFATENWSLTNAGCLLIFGSTATGTTNVVPSLSLLGPKIGIGGVTAPTNMVSLDGQAARTIWMERNYTSNTAGNTLTVQGGGATSGATNKAGGDLILAAGLSTGTGESGVKIQSSPAGGSGTGDNALATQFQVLGNKIGFFTVTPVVRQTQGATLTNNVTAGGSANTLANYTSLTIYSTDAAAIRNDIYQLGQTLKTVVDALRLYGLLT